MFRRYRWLQPTPRNFAVSKRRLKVWRRFGSKYQRTRVYRLLKEIETRRQQATSDSPVKSGNLGALLPYRRRFRQIITGSSDICHADEADVIRYYLAYCPPAMIPIGIWLVSECAHQFHPWIALFRFNRSRQVRKHVAKALRRMGAWWLLDEMAVLYFDDSAIQSFAKGIRKHRTFAARLSHYITTVDDSHAGEVATPSSMPFWARDEAWSFNPPKSVQAIRRMLRRIRHWVRWGAREETGR